ncbi:sensor histidine kinase [Streptomyces alkaliterrae]|uniref:histidine kinase n=1 Tax=Streptomyces alkaliterrae TaxID=2213162 RepID=A0A5P0YPM6_9ACTN|nr:sensor histidine kinase [Streptomyces alkaliterrae]MBB1257583.1 sensor histidine kinase [Streptomyces alkaliterrae]MQS02314.1 GHKL domain-containing protein [Streptomyces alkaliterrae]
MRTRLSLARQLFLLQLVVIALLVGSGALLVVGEARRDTQADAEHRATTLATALAELPEVRAAFAEDDPGVTLQPMAESVRRATGTDFIVFMATDRTRYSHPNPDRVGERFLGTIEPALAGGRVVETYKGTLGPSARVVVPVRADGGRVRGLLAVGILQEQIGAELRRRLPPVAGVSAAALVAAAAGSWLISRRLRRQTLGLGAAEITRLYESHDAVLRNVHEGLLIVDPRGRLTLANHEGRRLLALPEHPEDRPVAELGVGEPLAGMLTSGEPVRDRLCVYGDRVLVVNQERIVRYGRTLGTVTTLRDHTDIEALAGELDSVRGFAEALRSQAHESANRLHTVVTMIELGNPERAVEFATVELASAQQLADRLTDEVEEPALAALLLGKAAQAAEKGIELTVTEETAVTAVDEPAFAARDLVTLVGNLVDNAIDAALAGEPPRRVSVTARTEPDGTLLVRVGDSGRGVDSAHLEAIFDRGWSTKRPAESDRGGGRGLGLALVRQVINRYDGEVAVTSGEDGGAVFTVRLRPRAHDKRGGVS